jgi:hypothetical protein
MFFVMDKYKQCLNLTKQTSFDVRGDFYTHILEQFLQENSSEFLRRKVIYFPLSKYWPSVLELLRSSIKEPVMTQFYGVSRMKFSRMILDSLFCHKKNLICFFSSRKHIRYSYLVKAFEERFWDFLQTLPLFQIRLLLQTFGRHAIQTRSSLVWSVFGYNRIEVLYLSLEKKQMNMIIAGNRKQFTYYKSKPFYPSNKQISSFFANFIHSLDAFVVFRLLERVCFPVFTIHDSFGVPMSSVDTLRDNLKYIYINDFVLDAHCGKYFLDQFKNYLKKKFGYGSDSHFDFCKFVDSCIKFGDLSVSDLEQSFYFIYYD